MLICSDLPFRRLVTLNFKGSDEGETYAIPPLTPSHAHKMGWGDLYMHTKSLDPNYTASVGHDGLSTGSGAQTGNVVWVRGNVHREERNHQSHSDPNYFLKSSMGHA